MHYAMNVLSRAFQRATPNAGEFEALDLQGTAGDPQRAVTEQDVNAMRLDMVLALLMIGTDHLPAVNGCSVRSMFRYLYMFYSQSTGPLPHLLRPSECGRFVCIDLGSLLHFVQHFDNPSPASKAAAGQEDDAQVRDVLASLASVQTFCALPRRTPMNPVSVTFGTEVRADWTGCMHSPARALRLRKR